MMDTFQEFVFNIFVYGANIWIVFVDNDIQNMILNSMAMEFLMQLDNEFEEYYFFHTTKLIILFFTKIIFFALL